VKEVCSWIGFTLSFWFKTITVTYNSDLGKRWSQPLCSQKQFTNHWYCCV